MGTGRLSLIALLLLLIPIGCGAPNEPINPKPTAAASSSTPPPAQSPAPSRTVRQDPTSAAPSPSAPSRTGPDDPRWRFFTDDTTRYRSAWFDGAQRVMIGYGCTKAPFYVPDSRCRGGDGFHHGVDVALPCRTPLRAGAAGRVVDPARPGRPGPAYGSTAFRLRVIDRGARYDIVLGHATRVLVQPGDRVRRGQVIALAGARGAPDGCHLHFEQRRPDTGVNGARNPTRLLALRPA